MGRYLQIMGPAATFIAIAVILSAIVSIIMIGARKRAVEEQRATAADLCELSGILDPRALQDIFGPPTMDGVYNISLSRIKEVRTPLGHLISDERLDALCILIAIAALFFSYPLLDLFLMAAAAFQTAGWMLIPGFNRKSRR